MNYKLIINLIFFILLTSCEQSFRSEKIKFDLENRYKNSGFALIYNDNLTNIKKLD